MILGSVKSLTIPEGSVKKITADGVTIWNKVIEETPENIYSWEAVIAACANGTYATHYRVGDLIPLDLGSEGVVNMEIVGIDVDELTDGSGTAPLTFISKELLATAHRMNPARTTNEDTVYTEGTGSVGGWEKSEMRTYLKETIKPLIPASVANAIKFVNKTYYHQVPNSDSSSTIARSMSTDDLWIPSHREISGGSAYENSGVIYSDAFADSDSCIKILCGTTKATAWWLRTTGTTTGFRFVSTAGAYNSAAISSYERGIALGFCI